MNQTVFELCIFAPLLFIACSAFVIAAAQFNRDRHDDSGDVQDW